MDQLTQMNIFFIITSVAVVFFSIIASLILYQLLKLTQSVRRIIERVEAGSEQIAADAVHVRQFVVQGGIFSKMIGMMMGAMASGSRRRKDDE